MYAAFIQATQDVHERPAEPVPLHLRNAPTDLMTALGYGKDCQYAHDAPDALVDQPHLPEALSGRTYYHPTARGLEAEIGQRLERWRRWRESRRSPQ